MNLKNNLNTWEEYKNFVVKSFIYLYEKISVDRKIQFENYILKRKQRHTFHIVSPSPWPLMAAISAFIFVSGVLYFMHFFFSNLFIFGVLCLLTVKFVWFRDIIRESVYMGYHSINVQKNLRLAFMLFIISEVMFFFSFFWAYFHVSFCPSIFIGNIWPPEGIVFFFFSDYINVKSLFLDYYFFSNSFFDTILVRYLFNLYYTTFPYETHLNSNDVGLLHYLTHKTEYSPGTTLTNWETNFFTTFITEFRWDIYLGDEVCNSLFVKPTCILESSLDGSKFNETCLCSLINTGINSFIAEDFNYLLYNSDAAIENFIKAKIKVLNFLLIGSLINPENFFSIELKTSILPEFYFVKLGLFASPLPVEIRATYFLENKKIFVNIYSSGVLVNPYLIPLLNTIILLTSGATLTYSHISLRLERYLEAIFALSITILLGIFFFICQFYEYAHASFSLNDGIYGTVFYMLTGFHGFHVLIGTAMLFLCFMRFLNFHFTPNKHFGFEAAIWYWHFVDVVWIFLFFTLYLWPNNYYFTEFYLDDTPNAYNLNVSLSKIITDREFFDYSSDNVDWKPFAVRALWLIYLNDIVDTEANVWLREKLYNAGD